MSHTLILTLLLTVNPTSAAPVPLAAEGSQLQWTAAAVSEREKALQLLGRNGFAVIRNAAEEKIFLNRLEQTGVKMEWAQHKRTALWANFEQGLQVVCWRDIHTADTLQINGAEQVAGSRSGKRNTLRLALEVTIGVAKANSQAWKASCVWIPRAPRIEVPGPGKDEIWQANSTWGDVADGLQASLEVKQRQIKPGEDITLTMSLRNVRPARGDAVNDPIRVWDNKYSEGYRADFYLVVAPDGQSRILRRPEQPAWDKNVPTPITIEPGKSWTLAGIANDAIVKSLKELGLDTSKEGIYTITGYYEADASPGPKPTGPIPFWGGQIATPPVEVRVGEGEFKAPAPDKIKAAADAQTLYLGSPITVESTFLDAAKCAGFAAVAEVKALPQAGDGAKPAQLGIPWRDMLHAPKSVRNELHGVTKLLLEEGQTAANLQPGNRILVTVDQRQAMILDVSKRLDKSELNGAKWIPWSQSRQDALEAVLAPGWRAGCCPWCARGAEPHYPSCACRDGCGSDEKCHQNRKNHGECVTWTCSRKVGPATSGVTFRLWAFDPNGERNGTPRNECRIKAGADRLPFRVEVQNEKGETPEFQTPAAGRGS